MIGNYLIGNTSIWVDICEILLVCEMLWYKQKNIRYLRFCFLKIICLVGIKFYECVWFHCETLWKHFDTCEFVLFLYSTLILTDYKGNLLHTSWSSWPSTCARIARECITLHRTASNMNSKNTPSMSQSRALWLTSQRRQHRSQSPQTQLYRHHLRSPLAPTMTSNRTLPISHSFLRTSKRNRRPCRSNIANKIWRIPDLRRLSSMEWQNLRWRHQSNRRHKQSIWKNIQKAHEQTFRRAKESIWEAIWVKWWWIRIDESLLDLSTVLEQCFQSSNLFYL